MSYTLNVDFCKGIPYNSFIIIFLKEKKIMLVSIKERGQGMVEYALILVLVAVVVIAALTLLGPTIGNIFSTINGNLSS